MRRLFFIVSIASTGGLALHVSSTASTSAEELRQSSPLAGQLKHSVVRKRQLSRLTSEEIRNFLTGQRIFPNHSVPQTCVSFQEEFGADGAWEMSRTARFVMTKAGAWSVEDDYVCVVADKNPKTCRSIWHDRATNKNFIADYYRTQEGAGELIDVSTEVMRK